MLLSFDYVVSTWNHFVCILFFSFLHLTLQNNWNFPSLPDAAAVSTQQFCTLARHTVEKWKIHSLESALYDIFVKTSNIAICNSLKNGKFEWIQENFVNSFFSLLATVICVPSWSPVLHALENFDWLCTCTREVGFFFNSSPNRFN